VAGRAPGARDARRPARDAALTVLTTAAYARRATGWRSGWWRCSPPGASRWGFPAWLRLPAFGAADPAGALDGWAAVRDRARHSCCRSVLAAVGRGRRSPVRRAPRGRRARRGLRAHRRGQGRAGARAYGRHALRAALPPLVVLFALALPGVVAGSGVRRGVFAWPGVGRAVVQAVAARDYPVVIGAALLYAAVTVFANLAADLLLPVLDPRRRGA
jgi:peptide/nickel transport system permease protein